MVQFDKTIRTRINNQNDENRIYTIAADVEINNETQQVRITSGNVRKEDNAVANFSIYETSLSVQYYDRNIQNEVNSAINIFIDEATAAIKNIKF
jgi:hypothetical protein